MASSVMTENQRGGESMAMARNGGEAYVALAV